MQNWSIFAVLVAGILPVVCAGIAKAGLKSYDNHDPRACLQQVTGYRARANAAQANSFEAFPFFAAGVALALWAQVDAVLLNVLAWLVVLTRVAYIYCYVTDRATLRSLIWMLGFFASASLYVLAGLR